jgi:hypothetical protein
MRRRERIDDLIDAHIWMRQQEVTEMESRRRNKPWTIEDDRATVADYFADVLAEVVHGPDAKFTKRDVLAIAMEWLARELRKDRQPEALAHLRKAIVSFKQAAS